MISRRRTHSAFVAVGDRVFGFFTVARGARVIGTASAVNQESQIGSVPLLIPLGKDGLYPRGKPRGLGLIRFRGQLDK
jgi:hypothetical protein